MSPIQNQTQIERVTLTRAVQVTRRPFQLGQPARVWPAAIRSDDSGGQTWVSNYLTRPQRVGCQFLPSNSWNLTRTDTFNVSGEILSIPSQIQRDFVEIRRDLVQILQDPVRSCRYSTSSIHQPTVVIDPWPRTKPNSQNPSQSSPSPSIHNPTTKAPAIVEYDA